MPRIRGYSVDLSRRAFLQLQQSQAATNTVAGALIVPHITRRPARGERKFRSARLYQRHPIPLITAAAGRSARGVLRTRSSFESNRTLTSTISLNIRHAAPCGGLALHPSPRRWMQQRSEASAPDR